MTNWQKVLEFCDQSWNFTYFGPEIDILALFADMNKFSLESLHFPYLSENVNATYEQRDFHGKLRNDHGEY